MRAITHLVAVFLFLVPLLGAAAQQSVVPVSQAKADLLKMAAAGVGDDVLMAYVRNSNATFNLSADDIIALANDKVGSSVIRAVLNHDARAAAPAPSSASTTAPLNPDPSAAPAPLVEVVPAAPGQDYVWIPGYWSWGINGWVWVYGNWRPYGFYGWRHGRYYW